METLLNEILEAAKLARRIKTSAFDSDIMDLIEAAIEVLETRGVTAIKVEGEPGTEQGAVYSIQPMAKQAVITYVGLHFGQPDDYDRLKEAWETQLGQLMTTSGYTRW